MLIPRGVAKRIGPMATVADDAEDWDYTLRIALQYPVTLHRHLLVSWRIHGESRSGALERRQLEWALWRIRVLTRHRTLCASVDRDLVRARLLAEVRTTAYRAYGERWRGDRAFARRTLRRLIRLAPWEPRVWVAFAATCFPQRLVSYIARRAPRAIGGFAG